jgi:hypothetical protein
LKAQIDKVVNNYKSTTLRASRSGRDEAKDLTLFEPALKKYFQDADGALSAMADSFDRNVLSSDASGANAGPRYPGLDGQPDALVRKCRQTSQ